MVEEIVVLDPRKSGRGRRARQARKTELSSETFLKYVFEGNLVMSDCEGCVK